MTDTEQAREHVATELLDRAELAWQRFFYPSNECFTNDGAYTHVSVDLELADCLRLVLTALGRSPRTPNGEERIGLPSAVLAAILSERSRCAGIVKGVRALGYYDLADAIRATP
jgi:hypothetical protein